MYIRLQHPAKENRYSWLIQQFLKIIVDEVCEAQVLWKEHFKWHTTQKTPTFEQNQCLPLSVTELGPIAATEMAPGLKGDTPVFLKPAIMFFVVMEEFQAGTNTSQKFTLLRGLPWCSELYLLRWLSQAILKDAKGAESSGCRRCEVWGGDSQNFNVVCPHAFIEGQVI